MENYKKITKIGNNEIVIETGKVARQATGAVLVSSGNTQVLSTVVYVAGVLSSAPGLPQLKPVLNVLQLGMKLILWKKENA